MTSPLLITFDVACPPAHAFAVWTVRIADWWPSDHTVTGGPGLQVVLETGVGGRIYERAPDGVEHEWGQVTVWDPPARLAYLWHLGRDRTEATEVDIRFVARDGASTTVRIEHRGWETLGQTAEVWRDRNQAGWRTLLPHFAAAIGNGGS